MPTRSSRWEAATSARRTRAPPRRRSAASGKSIANSCTSEPMDAATHYAVENLLARYIHCIDEDRLDEWPGFFAETCRYQITTAENHERGLPIGIFFATSRGQLKDRVSALREANIFEPQRY